MLKKAFLYQIALHERRTSVFLANQKLFFFTNLSFLLSKAIVFCPLLPIRTTLNLLFAKNAAVLLLFALILCCKARTSHRFKSLPAISGNLAIPDAAGYLMNAGHFRKNHVSSGDLNRPRESEGRNPLISLNTVALLTSVRNSPCFGGLRRTKTCHWQLFARPSVFLGTFCTPQKVPIRFPYGSFEVFQTSIQLAATAASHKQN